MHQIFNWVGGFYKHELLLQNHQCFLSLCHVVYSQCVSISNHFTKTQQSWSVLSRSGHVFKYTQQGKLQALVWLKLVFYSITCLCHTERNVGWHHQSDKVCMHQWLIIVWGSSPVWVWVSLYASEGHRMRVTSFMRKSLWMRTWPQRNSWGTQGHSICVAIQERLMGSFHACDYMFCYAGENDGWSLSFIEEKCITIIKFPSNLLMRVKYVG